MSRRTTSLFGAMHRAPANVPAAGPSRRIVMLAALTAVAVSAKAAEAASDPPAFSRDDQELIRRNASLGLLLARDPAAAAMALRALRAHDLHDRTVPFDPPVPRPPEFDPKGDPDLSELEHVAPEAAHDLFVLIKKASMGKPK